MLYASQHLGFDIIRAFFLVQFGQHVKCHRHLHCNMSYEPRPQLPPHHHHHHHHPQLLDQGTKYIIQSFNHTRHYIQPKHTTRVAVAATSRNERWTNKTKIKSPVLHLSYLSTSQSYDIWRCDPKLSSLIHHGRRRGRRFDAETDPNNWAATSQPWNFLPCLSFGTSIKKLTTLAGSRWKILVYRPPYSADGCLV